MNNKQNATPTSTTISAHDVLIWPRETDRDPTSQRLLQRARQELSLDFHKLLVVKCWSFAEEIDAELQQRFVAEVLQDPVLQASSLHRDVPVDHFSHFILVNTRPGVRDDEQDLARDLLNEMAHSTKEQAPTLALRHLYFIKTEHTAQDLRKFAQAYLANPILQHIESGSIQDLSSHLHSMHKSATTTPLLPQARPVQAISLDLEDPDLLRLSKQRVWALNLDELKTIRAHFTESKNKRWRNQHGLPADPTECELEVFAQSWSEHCKHKEFNARIEDIDLDTGERSQIDGLLNSYVRAATTEIQQQLEQANNNWLLKVFDDNAGVVRIDKKQLFVWKVETHNSPSALDPYGGALTGILGNNRDPLGTGRGGAKLLFNTDVLCFGHIDDDKSLFPGQLHPRRVLRGVRQGIEDGGNKSGIPTINGALIFDDSYRGKPLVFCGTGGIMARQYKGQDSWVKEILPGDHVVMAGGRVGRDGIHGATFSSQELGPEAPQSAVQIGSPFTQKKLADFLHDATGQGLIRCTTDNGAGGLASSVGELAPLSGGVEIDLAKVPLKYPGLQPWEILVSESQERMTLAVAPDLLDALFGLAKEYEVELSDLGVFNDSGRFDVYFHQTMHAALNLDFLHHGLPQKQLRSEWSKPALKPYNTLKELDFSRILTKLLASPNICSREPLLRQFDHEVKGRSVVKAFMGPSGHAPQDAALMRLDLDGFAGIAVSNGIMPRYGLLDPYAMSTGSFDKAVRQIMAIGGQLPNPSDPHAPWWSACDNFCMPDVVYDPVANPDGPRKLGALVRMARGLYDSATAYGVPLTSGKDSMKNDLRHKDEKVSVMPTVLYSIAAGFSDIRRAVTTDFKAAGDVIFLLGQSYDELGGSAFLQLFDQLGQNAPQVRFAQARKLYQQLALATQQGLIESCHDLGLGGLAVALAESCIGSGFGAEILLPQSDLSPAEQLFSESHSRFVMSTNRENTNKIKLLFKQNAQQLGFVSSRAIIEIKQCKQNLLQLDLSQAERAWRLQLEL